MTNTETFDLLYSLCIINDNMSDLVKEFSLIQPLKLEYSFFGQNRKEWPDSPLGISWELNIEKSVPESYFIFEISNESGLWFVTAEHSLARQETINTFIEQEFKDFSKLFTVLDDLLNNFISSVKQTLEHIE